MARTPLATRRHEAAHAVIGQLLGATVSHVQIGARGQSYCQFRRKFRTPLMAGLTLMAGSAAEHLWHGTPRGLVSAHDLSAMKGMGFKGEDYRVLWEEAQRLVRRNKRAIWRLAKQLRPGRNRL